MVEFGVSSRGWGRSWGGSFLRELVVHSAADSPLAIHTAGSCTPQPRVSSHRLHWLSLTHLWSQYLPSVPSPGRVWVKLPGCPHHQALFPGDRCHLTFGDAPLACSTGLLSTVPLLDGFSRWCTSRPRSLTSCLWFSSSEESPCLELALEFGTSSHLSGRNSRMPRWAYGFVTTCPWGEWHMGTGPELGRCWTEGVRLLPIGISLFSFTRSW